MSAADAPAGGRKQWSVVWHGYRSGWVVGEYRWWWLARLRALWGNLTFSPP